jgi:organic radical activating enzyme
VQGEGHHAGRRALFVRMPFCNLKCAWCDTEFNSYTTWTQERFAELIGAPPAMGLRFAVITGGEPTMNKHTSLVIATLKQHGFEIAIESNGHFPVPDGIDFVTISPKANPTPTPYFVHDEAWKAASEFKYVVDDKFDFQVLKHHNQEYKLGRSVHLSLSPEFNEMAKNVEKILEYQKEHAHWKLSLQTHKWINVK